MAVGTIQHIQKILHVSPYSTDLICSTSEAYFTSAPVLSFEMIKAHLHVEASKISHGEVETNSVLASINFGRVLLYRHPVF